ncbi:hypothetical protein LSH36_1283g00020 [Paralvinella palmiformis]|uniref:EF-hand domain-containing protein n=1 Tax=Paralvinella palmiformis TaxID=53620 RepID=A0AAD9ITF8_9ANNE|nr:hypothetical protein LSH36_1283g00020 [Paralvinella palmiformis]
MHEHVTSVCRAAYYHLKNIHCLKAFLTQESLVTVVHAFVTSRIDYCNSLLLQVPVSQLKSYALKTTFMLFDYDKDGKIYTADIGLVIRAVGLKPTESEVKEISHIVEDNYNGQVDLQTLVTLISSKVTTPAPERAEDLIEIFRMYDKDGRGTVRVQEMHHLLTTVGEKLTDEEAENLLKMSGCVSNGLVDYQKFVRLVLQG